MNNNASLIKNSFKTILKKTESKNQLKNFNINFGPKHPAARGVLRLIL